MMMQSSAVSRIAASSSRRSWLTGSESLDTAAEPTEARGNRRAENRERAGHTETPQAPERTGRRKRNTRVTDADRPAEPYAIGRMKLRTQQRRPRGSGPVSGKYARRRILKGLPGVQPALMKTPCSSLFDLLRRACRRNHHAPLATSGTLDGAQAKVLDCRPAHSWEVPTERGSRFTVEALIRPAAPDCAWQPGALTLLPESSEAEFAREGETCRVLRAEVLERRRFRAAAHCICTGARRVRLEVVLSSGLTSFCFSHLEARFGRFDMAEMSLMAA